MGHHAKRSGSHPLIKAHKQIYGNNDLDFVVIKICDEQYLQFWEQYYISELNPPLNAFRFAGRVDEGFGARRAAQIDIAKEFQRDHNNYGFLTDFTILPLCDRELFPETLIPICDGTE